MNRRNTRRKKNAASTRRTHSSRVKNSLYTKLVESSPLALIAVSPDGTILLWNARAETVYGYSKEEAVGRRMANLVASPDRVDETNQIFSQAVETELVDREVIHRRKDGSDICVNLTARSVRKESGEIEFVALSHRNVTPVKEFGRGKVLDAGYRSLLESVPDAIVMVNHVGRIVFANGQAEGVLGYTRDELLGEPVEILLPERYRANHIGFRTGYFSDPRTRAMGAGLELLACRKDGAEFPVEISLSPLNTEGERLAISAIRDVSERKKLQEELRGKNDELEQQNQLIQQANRLKSEFLANMSHELRTPLNGIIGFAEIMHDERVGPIADSHKEFLKDILTSARHLLQLINDVLDLAKIEAGKLEVNPEKTDAEMVVGEVRDIVRTLAASKRIMLRVEIDPSLGALETDSRRLKQILYNYVSNAIKFTPEGGQVTVRLKPEGAAQFRVEVEDNGVGIRPEDLNRLFVEFQQLDTTSSKQYAGTGLGLALTKRLVEAQGGHAGATSVLGTGSLFYATLPRVLGVVSDPAATAATPFAAAHAPRILVIEDDVNERTWLSQCLGSAGYTVHAVSTGGEALMRCREQRFDAITLDILLSDTNGRDVLLNLRRDGLNQKTPVIVVTSSPSKGIVAGFQVADILPKPVSQHELVAALERSGVASNTVEPIFVVDDDAPSLKLAGQMLARLGYRAICHQDAASALRASSKEHPAAVVLDLVMPEMSGFEFLKQFRRTPHGRRTPVIVWTSKELSNLERRRLRSATTTISKKTEEANDLVLELQSILRGPMTFTTTAN